jgi:hypothetical protein
MLTLCVCMCVVCVCACCMCVSVCARCVCVIRMSRHILLIGLANLLLSPIIFIWQIFYSFFRYAEVCLYLLV